jgi:hypothetical protein
MPSGTQVQDQAPEQYDLGVLFVHGIGDQQQNSTLARFGGSLQRWLGRWLEPDGAPGADRIAPEPTVEVTAVQRRSGDGDTPAHASLLVGRPGEPAVARQRWLLAEGVVGGRGLAAELQGVRPLGAADPPLGGGRVRRGRGPAAPG